MKKIIFFLLIFTALRVQATAVLVSIKNLTQNDIIFKSHTGDFEYAYTWGEHLPEGYSIKPGETFSYWSGFFLMAGAEGSIILGTADSKYQFSVNFNNPFIGASEYSQTIDGPYNWRLVSLNKEEAFGTQKYTLELLTVEPPAPKVPIPSSGSGIIKGAVRWNNDVGSPDIALKQDAFKVIVHVPQYFQPLPNAKPTESKIYFGQPGRFDGQQNTGNIIWSIQVFSNYIQLNYLITGITVNVPISFDIICRDNVKWTPGPGKPFPGDASYTYIVGSFLVNNNFQNAINDTETIVSGVDFECLGEWCKVDANGNFINNDVVANKIANRKTAPVLPEGILTLLNSTKTTGSGMMQPAATKTNQGQNNQIQTKQTQNVMQKVRIRN